MSEHRGPCDSCGRPNAKGHYGEGWWSFRCDPPCSDGPLIDAQREALRAMGLNEQEVERAIEPLLGTFFGGGPTPEETK